MSSPSAVISSRWHVQTVLSLFLLSWLVPTSDCPGQEEGVSERLVLDCSINGESVKLAVDTGTTWTTLNRPTADRLHLAVSPPTAGMAKAGFAGVTEDCRITIDGVTQNAQLAVMDVPPGVKPDIDGFVGWKAFERQTFLFDGAARSWNVLTEVPDVAKKWERFHVRPHEGALKLDLPIAGGGNAFVLIDTGAYTGLSVPGLRWKGWAAAHHDDPATLLAYFTPVAGLVVAEEKWASETSIGGLRLTDVAVSEEPPSKAKEPGFAGTLGLAAVFRLQMVVDGANGIAYVKPVDGPPPTYRHNRLGATFVPEDAGGPLLRARVAKGSPADLAGIREGDALKKIDDVDFTRWRTDPGVMPIGRFFERKAGTPITLTVERDGSEHVIRAELKEILGPKSK